MWYTKPTGYTVFSIHTLNSCWRWFELHACTEGTKYLYLKHKAINLPSSFPRIWYSFQTQLHHPQVFCYGLRISQENLNCGIPQLGIWLFIICISGKNELMRMYEIIMMIGLLGILQAFWKLVSQICSPTFWKLTRFFDLEVSPALNVKALPLKCIDN